MNAFLKRIVALFTVFVICFSIMVVPASAADGSTFWDYFSLNFAKENISNWWKTLFGSDDPDTAYTDYVTTVKDVLGTSTLGDNCVYLGNWSYDVSNSNDSKWSYEATLGGSTLNLSGSVGWTSGKRYVSYVSAFEVPASGSYTFTGFGASTYSDSFSLSNQFYLCQNDTVLVGSDWKGSLTYNLQAGDLCSIRFTATSGIAETGSFTISFACRMEYPTGGFEAAAGSTNVSPETRTGSLCGDYFYSGDNGSMTQAENIYLFDETNNIINNPAEGTTATASSWKYDYETRTYTITATDGSTYTIVHGDESAEVKHTDSSNTTNIYNYYYGTNGGSGEDPGEDPGDDSGENWLTKLLGKIGDFFGSVVGGLLEIIGNALLSIMDSLITLVNTAIEKLASLVNLFGSFGEALRVLWTWLPDDVIRALPSLCCWAC